MLDLLHDPRLRHRVSVLIKLQRVEALVLLGHLIELPLLLINFKQFGSDLSVNMLDQDLERLAINVFLQFQAVEVVLNRLINHWNELSDNYFADTCVDLFRKVFAYLCLLLDFTLVLRHEVPLSFLILLGNDLVNGRLGLPSNLAHYIRTFRAS